MNGKDFRELVDSATHVLGGGDGEIGVHRPGYGRYAELVGVGRRTLMRYFVEGPTKPVVILARLIADRKVSVRAVEEAGE